MSVDSRRARLRVGCVEGRLAWARSEEREGTTNMKKKSWLLSTFAVLTCCVAMLAAFAGTAWGADTPLSSAKGSIVLGNVENGVSISVYRVVNVTWDDAANEPKDPVYTWDSKVATWLDGNGYSSFVDTTKQNAVTDKYVSTTTAGVKADTEFFGKLTAFVTDTNSGVKKLEEGSDKDYQVVRSGSDDTASVTLTGLTMGQYLVVIGNSTGYVYSPVAAVIAPKYVEADHKWKLDESAATVIISAKRRAIGIKKEVDKTHLSVGDFANFTLSMDVPAYPVGAINKEFNVYDAPSSGLTFVKNDKFKVYGVAEDGTTTELYENNAYTITTSGVKLGDKDQAFKIAFVYDKVSSYKSIKVTYEAKLNDNAVVGDKGNPNTATLEYSNDPYGEKEHNTTPGNTTVFTYGFDITKVEDGNANVKLNGAKFKVYKGNKAEGNALKFSLVNGVYVYDPDNGTSNEVVSAEINGEAGKIKLAGLDLGSYTFEETEAPEGYYLPSGTFTFIIADRDNNGKVEVNNAEQNTGYLAAQIKNSNSMFQLPVTGGTGTVVLTAVGVAGMLGAAIVLARGRRHN